MSRTLSFIFNFSFFFYHSLSLIVNFITLYNVLLRVRLLHKISGLFLCFGDAIVFSYFRGATFKGATKPFIMHYSWLVIIFFSTGLHMSAFSLPMLLVNYFFVFLYFLLRVLNLMASLKNSNIYIIDE